MNPKVGTYRPGSGVASPREEKDLCELVSDHLGRFAKLVALDKGTGCLEWQGQKNRQGYGKFSYNGKQVMAHRFAYAVKNIKEVDYAKFNSLSVCHSCDNPGCVNPNHLFLGTRKANNVDYGMALRIARDKMKRLAIDDLCKEEVLAIRAAIRRKEPIEQVALKYLLTPSQANLVYTSDDWPWLK